MASTAFACSWQRGPSLHEGPFCNNENPKKRGNGQVVLHTHREESHSNQGILGLSRRGWLALSFCSATMVCRDGILSGKQHREDAAEAAHDDDGKSHGDDGGVDGKPDSSLSGPLSLFDPNEKTKSGKLLPKSYLKRARQVVKSLKESLKEESSKESDVRRSADSAKEAIRDYLQNWRGQKLVASEESYKALESAFRILGNFYAKAGPRAVLPSDVKSQILENLDLADAAL